MAQICSVLQLHPTSGQKERGNAAVLPLADGFSHLIMQVQYYITGELGCLQ